MQKLAARAIRVRISLMVLTSLLIHWFVSGLAIALTSALAPGFRVKGFTTALVASLFIGAANTYVRPLLVFFTFPLTVLTLGLFLFVIDAFILKLCEAFLKNFEVSGWWSAFFASIILAITSSLLHGLVI